MISDCVITRNEETDIARCQSSHSFADEIVVVDSGSADITVEKAKEFTNKVFFNVFSDFASQKNFAMSKCINNWLFPRLAMFILTGRLYFVRGFWQALQRMPACIVSRKKQKRRLRSLAEM